jgi:antitoxin StbD
MTYSKAFSTKEMVNHIVPITRFNRGEANKIFEELKETGVKTVFKNNLPVGVLIEPEQYDEMLELLEDYALNFEAERRSQNSSMELLSESQVMEKLNITESDLGEGDVEIDS